MARLRAPPLGPALLALQRDGLHCDAEVRLCSAKAVMHYAVLAARCTALHCAPHPRCTQETPKIVSLASSDDDVFTTLDSDASRQHEVLEKFVEFLYGVEITLSNELLPLLRDIAVRLGCAMDVNEQQCGGETLEVSTHRNILLLHSSSAENVIATDDDFIRKSSPATSDIDPGEEEKMSRTNEATEPHVPIKNHGVCERKNGYSSFDVENHRENVSCDHQDIKKYDGETSTRRFSIAVSSSSSHESSSNTIASDCAGLEKRDDSNLSTDDQLGVSGVGVSPSLNYTSPSTVELEHECRGQGIGSHLNNAVPASKKSNGNSYALRYDSKGLTDVEDSSFSACVPDISILTIENSSETSLSHCVHSVENPSGSEQNSNEVELKTKMFLEAVPSVAVCSIDSEGRLSTSYPSSLTNSSDEHHGQASVDYRQSASRSYVVSEASQNVTRDGISETSAYSIVCKPALPLSSFEAVESCLSSETTKSAKEKANSELKHSDQIDFVTKELHCLTVPISDTPGTNETLALMQTPPSSSSSKRAVAVSTLVDAPFDGSSLACTLPPNAFVPISGMLPSSQGGLQCGHCQVSFRKCSDLVKHVLSCSHFTETCPICLAKAPDVESQRNHFVLHDSPLPFFCHGCDLRFRTRAHLAMHAPKHSSARPFSCPECSRAFKWRHALQAHLLTHRPMGHLLCDVCGFSSNYITTFKAHLQQHSGEAFSCTQPGCSFKAFRKDNLKAHLGTHSNVRPHQCEVCGTSFSLFRNLRRHMRVHSGLRLQCASCPFTTTRADKLRCHVSAKHHTALDPAESREQSDPAERVPTLASVSPYGNVEEMHSENGILATQLGVEHSGPSVNDHLVLSVTRQDASDLNSRGSDDVVRSQKRGRRKSSRRTKCVDTHARNDLAESSIDDQADRVTHPSSCAKSDFLSSEKTAKKRIFNRISKRRKIELTTKRKVRPICPKPPPKSTNSISCLEGKLDDVSNDNLLAAAPRDAR